MTKKFIGTGAAGNKAVIELIKNGTIESSKALLLNSTTKDIPLEFRNDCKIFGDSIHGCGKETALAAKMILTWIKGVGGEILDSFIDPQDDSVIIINSTEGGSGCGSAPIIADYYKQVHNLNIINMPFTGFKDDVRGLQNTIEYFQKMNSSYTIQPIANSKFMREANSNSIIAERLANKELVRRVEVLLGSMIIDSEVNMDETDLYKSVTMPGFMTIETAYLDRSIKNSDDFYTLLDKAIHDSKSLDIAKPSAKRIGVIINANPKITESIDLSFANVKKTYGMPGEFFKHIQYHEDLPEAVHIIVSGMKMPEDEIMEIYTDFKDQSGKVDTANDSFFDNIKSLDVSDSLSSSVFNSAKTPDTMQSLESAKNKFYASNGVADTADQKKNKAKEIVLKREAFADKY